MAASKSEPVLARAALDGLIDWRRKIFSKNIISIYASRRPRIPEELDRPGRVPYQLYYSTNMSLQSRVGLINYRRYK